MSDLAERVAGQLLPALMGNGLYLCVLSDGLDEDPSRVAVRAGGKLSHSPSEFNGQEAPAVKPAELRTRGHQSGLWLWSVLNLLRILGIFKD